MLKNGTHYVCFSMNHSLGWVQNYSKLLSPLFFDIYLSVALKKRFLLQINPRSSCARYFVSLSSMPELFCSIRASLAFVLPANLRFATPCYFQVVCLVWEPQTEVMWQLAIKYILVKSIVVLWQHQQEARFYLVEATACAAVVDIYDVITGNWTGTANLSQARFDLVNRFIRSTPPPCTESRVRYSERKWLKLSEYFLGNNYIISELFFLFSSTE